MKLILLFCYLVGGASFLVGREHCAQPSRSRSVATTSLRLRQGKNSWNPFKEVSDMMNNFDDVIDDFLNKRMGNGEIFYGQRKYKPLSTTQQLGCV